MAKVEASGTAKAGLTTGIIGTALGGLLTLQNGGLGGLGGLFGCGNNNAYNSNLQAEIAQLKAERYADTIGIEAYKQTVADNKAFSDRLFDKYIEPISKEIADMRVREAVTAEKIHCLGQEFRSAIALESERRVAGDQNLMCYVNATFVPGKLVMPKDSICPPVMPQYNSWTAPTTPTTAG